MEKIQSLRGFRDIQGDEARKFARIERVSRRHFELLGYHEIGIPVLEKTELFKRSIGDTTDIVEKEMFTFIDRSGESLTLRPEATAGVVRAYLQAGLYAKERVSKLFMIGPMFRHERPQKGRFRQFHQVDVEIFGVAEPIVDAEFLWMISLILGELGVRNYTFEVNSVGCKGCREEFRKVLIAYLEGKKDLLCEDCTGRVTRNPLRVFDCKVEQCIALTQGSPLLFDYLCDECRKHFEQYLEHTGRFGLPVFVNKRLVRGLDYYTKTVFEVTSSELGAQKAFCAGGRYDNLIHEMGGPAVSGTGFAIGIERLALLMPEASTASQPLYFLATVGDEPTSFLVPLLKSFLAEGLALSYSPSGRSLKSQMKHADSLGASYALILGEEEVRKGTILVRNMKDGSQTELPLDVSGLPRAVARLANAKS